MAAIFFGILVACVLASAVAFTGVAAASCLVLDGLEVLRQHRATPIAGGVVRRTLRAAGAAGLADVGGVGLRTPQAAE